MAPAHPAAADTSARSAAPDDVSEGSSAAGAPATADVPWTAIDPQSDRVAGLGERQRLRMQRFAMAALSAALVAGILACFVLAGHLPLRAWVVFTLGTAALGVAFWWMFRSGLNLRCRDASLTLPLAASALASLVAVMAQARGSHALLSMLYVLPFAFGTLRLDTRRLLVLASLTLAADLAIALASVDRVATRETRMLELLRWTTLGIVLVWFAFMGGFLSRLRAHVADTNRRLAHAAETIRHMATHDELTGVSNRRHLVEVLKAEAARSERYGSAWSVCLVDLDFFKRVNDTLGHAAGDRVLAGIATAIAHAKRPTDAFGRWGGEELLLVLAQTRFASAEIAAERMRLLVEGVKHPSVASGLRVTVSIGVTEHVPGETWQATLERADRALYLAKARGRNRIESLRDGTSRADLPVDDGNDGVMPTIDGDDAPAPSPMLLAPEI